MNNLLIILSATMDFGWTVALVGYFIIIISLALLVIIFTRMPKLIYMKIKKPQLKQQKTESKNSEKSGAVEGNVIAAISMSLHYYYNDQHDEESNIVTIKKVRKAYSPWSSKIYSVTNNWPR